MSQTPAGRFDVASADGNAPSEAERDVPSSNNAGGDTKPNVVPASGDGIGALSLCYASLSLISPTLFAHLILGLRNSSAIGKPQQNRLSRNPPSRSNASNLSPAMDEDHQPRPQTAIDPLSQHILKRTRTENTIPPKLRTGPPDMSISTITSASPAPLETSTRKSTEPNRLELAGASKEKKKGVSFLSRFIGNKKKEEEEDFDENESEHGDKRTEGINAPVFSQPIYSNGYTPQHPPPPKYIKVRSRNKKVPSFNRVFLAQELSCRTDISDATRPSNGRTDYGTTSSSGRAVWALEFSKDGRFIAAGGQDKLVRVWAVISTSSEREAHEKEENNTSAGSSGEGVRLNAPVFKTDTIRAYEGHTADVLDLSWSKNNFLLSSSMDKTVRLWHVSRGECLCCFKHSDFVTSISFHPRDDRFFLAGSLDSKLRLWSIPDKGVAFWNQLPDLITAVAFSPDGKTAIAGCLNGLCLFYETEGLKYHTQIHARSSHGRNAKGSKITGIQTMHFPPDDPSGEVKLLITSNDSRVRLYNFRDKSLEMKFRGNENTCSQIHANFSDDARYVICGSEDRKVYIWSTRPAEGDKKDKRPVEMFAAHPAIVTTAVMAPTKTRKLLDGSGDPLYDICNPPPVRLFDQTESHASSRAPTDADHHQSESGEASRPTPSRPPSIADEYSPGYIARSAHSAGNIIVTADYTGDIKVFRQDCAFAKRRMYDTWDTGSTFSKKLALNRSPSLATRASNRSRTSNSGPRQHSDRILSWRNSITGSAASLENPSPRSASLRNTFAVDSRTRSTSPQKSSLVNVSGRPDTQQQPHHHSQPGSTPLVNTTTMVSSPTISVSTASPTASEPTSPQVAGPAAPSNPLTHPHEFDSALINESGQSYTFWHKANWDPRMRPGPQRVNTDTSLLSPQNILSKQTTRVSALSSDEEDEAGGTADGGAGAGADGSAGEELKCRKCAGTRFKAREAVGRKSREVICLKCGTAM
ncbi:MAG: hypothetical protein M1825_001990 [Sarcosagium campestre]|nr:MAG: hypothetical protein M1825_001990 [Sarcosagium campestre]